jgi:hypothetical protein
MIRRGGVYWASLNLQLRYDLELEKDRLGDRLRREVAVYHQAARESHR